MKFSLAILTSTLAAASATTFNVDKNSKAASNLISKARKLDGGDAADYSFLTSYSVKFQGCHHISQWNDEGGDDADEVRIETKRLVRFRLCESDDCSASLGVGCKSGYGDYLVDMNEFMAYHLENKEETQQAACEAYEETYCADCEDDYYPDSCKATCFGNAGMDYCIEDEDEDAFDVNDYLECAAFEPPANNYYRKLEDAAAQYYIGPFCADQGGEILMGLFTDDTCTEFADDYGGKATYESLVGSSLPYSSKSLVDTDCYTCAEEPENDDDKYYQAPETKEFCATLYAESGKCETNMDISYPNENACTYMEGIKMTTTNGIILTGAGGKNKVASAFIGIFAVSFILLGSYVYYLKTKLDRVRINLSD